MLPVLFHGEQPSVEIERLGTHGEGELVALTPRQMLAFGEMYLAGGRWKGVQVVPQEWVRASFEPRGRSHRSGQLYGYGWWIREIAGRRTYFAWGYGGQSITTEDAKGWRNQG